MDTSIAWIKKGFAGNFCHGLAVFSSGMLLAGTSVVAQRIQGSEAFAQGKSLLSERNLLISPNKSLQEIKCTGDFHYQMPAVRTAQVLLQHPVDLGIPKATVLEGWMSCNAPISQARAGLGTGTGSGSCLNGFNGKLHAKSGKERFEPLAAQEEEHLSKHSGCCAGDGTVREGFRNQHHGCSKNQAADAVSSGVSSAQQVPQEQLSCCSRWKHGLERENV